MDEPIFIDPADLAGVDQETYAAADSGDRQAQKVVLRNLLTKQASAAALTTEHWTYWMLRMIATGDKQAIGDSLGSIAEGGRKGSISAHRLKALNEMYEQHFGPGEVGEPAAGNALSAFEGEDRGEAVVGLFLLADRLASGSPGITIAEVTAAGEVADALGATGAKAFFNAVMAQMLAGAQPQAAFQAAVESVQIFAELAAGDPIYQPKLGQTALLAAQIAQMAGEPEAATLMNALHADAIAAYRATEE